MNPSSDSIQQISRRDAIKALALASGSLTLTTPALGSVLGFDSSNAHDPDTILKWYKLKPNFYAMVDLNTGGNVLVHASQGEVLLIDTKYPHLAGALRADALAVSGRDAPNLTLINTHHHGDHTAGNAMVIPFASASYAHANAIPRIQSQLDSAKQAGVSSVERVKGFSDSAELVALAQIAVGASQGWTNTEITPKNVISTPHKKIMLGETIVSMYHFGTGHTDNDLVVHFEDDNVIHTGDLVFNGLHPFFDPSANVSPRGWVESLNSILKLCDDSTTIVPGHGEPSTRSIVENQINYIERLIENVQAAIDTGSSKEDAMKMEWDFMKGLGFESIRPRAISAVYDDLKS
ncbi:MAG: MBL fold metallo-hydrolase [Phycisphaerales bacterium]